MNKQVYINNINTHKFRSSPECLKNISRITQNKLRLIKTRSM